MLKYEALEEVTSAKTELYFKSSMLLAKCMAALGFKKRLALGAGPNNACIKRPLYIQGAEEHGGRREKCVFMC